MMDVYLAYLPCDGALRGPDCAILSQSQNRNIPSHVTDVSRRDVEGPIPLRVEEDVADGSCVDPAPGAPTSRATWLLQAGWPEDICLVLCRAAQCQRFSAALTRAEAVEIRGA